MHLKSILVSMLVLLAALVSPEARAARSYDNCTGFITSLPAVITTQGTWCLDRDLSTATAIGTAITVQTNNVTIDCNDFKLGGLAAGDGTQAYGISASERLNTTVRNCNVRGFFLGVILFSSDGSVVEDSRFDGNTALGIGVSGQGFTVRRNVVTSTGGSTVSNNSIGISIAGEGDVLDNSVDGVVAGGGNGTVEGIYVNESSTALVSGNRIRALVPAGVGLATGIRFDSSGLVTATDNLLHGDLRGSAVGISCVDGLGVARGNVIRGFGTPRLGCADGGNNYTAPALL